MLRNVDLTRFVALILPESVKFGYSHRTLVAFHTSTLLEFISRSKLLDEETLAILLPSLMETLQPNAKTQTNKDPVVNTISSCNDTFYSPCPQLSSYILLSALSQKANFSQKALRLIVTAVAKSVEDGSDTAHAMNTILSICAPQSQLEKVPSSVVKVVLASPCVSAVLLFCTKPLTSAQKAY